MSQDQKPAGMRVVGSPSTPLPPQRDVDQDDAREPATEAGAIGAELALPAARGTILLSTLIFLVGCVLGGIGFVLLRVA